MTDRLVFMDSDGVLFIEPEWHLGIRWVPGQTTWPRNDTHLARTVLFVDTYEDWIVVGVSDTPGRKERKVNTYRVVFRRSTVTDETQISARSIVKAAKKANEYTKDGYTWAGWSVYSITLC